MSVIKQLGKCGLSLKGTFQWASRQGADYEDLCLTFSSLFSVRVTDLGYGDVIHKFKIIGKDDVPVKFLLVFFVITLLTVACY